MCNGETDSLSNILWLVTEALPLLIVPPPPDYLPILVLVQAVPQGHGTLKAAVHGKTSLNGRQRVPDQPRCRTTVTAITLTSHMPVHLLVMPGILRYWNIEMF